MPYQSYITNAQAIYNGLSAAFFPGGVKPPGLFLDEPPTTKGSSPPQRLHTPWVIIHDLGNDPRWTFTSDANNIPGQNAIVIGGFFIEIYYQSVGDCNQALAAILWNGQIPNKRAGLAFANLDLISPRKGIPAEVVPGKDITNYAQFDEGNARVHVLKQWFKVTTGISGAG